VSGDDAPTLELALANVHFRMGHVDEALRRYERFEREHRKDARASAAARRTIECLRLLGRESDAVARATRIEHDYPTSSEATLAREAVRARQAATEPAPAKGPVHYIVQVAAMSDPANAARLAQQVRTLKLGPVQVEKVDGPDGVIHRVLLGPFDDEARAHAAVDSITTLGGDVQPRVRSEPAR
jgi:cell division septation protein DedD